MTWSRTMHSAPRLRARRCLPRLEALESRHLLSVQPFGSEFQVNTYTAGDQALGEAANYAAASDSDGDRVVVWSSFGQDGDSWGVFAQRYAADGTKLGVEFRVNATTAGAQLLPAVAMDPDGDFVIAWVSQGQDGAGDGVFAQRFDAAGARRGHEFRVNSTTAGNQTEPAVGMDGAGGFVVAWTSPDSDQQGIVARRYDFDGLALGDEFSVNTTTAGAQTDPVVGRALDGRTVIAWTSSGQDGDSNGIVARRWDANGDPSGDEVMVNQFTAGAQERPALVVARGGAFIVAWQSAGQDGAGAGVVARLFAADGSAAGNEAVVNTTFAGDQRDPAVALDGSGGFVVAWTAASQDGDGTGVYARAFAAAGNALSGELLVNTYTTSDQERPSIALDAAGDFVVAWQSANQDGDGLGVFGQRFGQGLNDSFAPLATGAYLPNDPHRLANGERLTFSPSQLVVTFSEAMSESGAGSVTNPANYQLTLFGADYSAAITSVTYGLNAATHRYEAKLNFATPLPRGEYTLTAFATLTDAGANALDGDSDGQAGGAMQLAFTVADIEAVGPETPVNVTTLGDQVFTSGAPGTIAADHHGNYVITWSSQNQDGAGWGVYARRFSAAGEPLGPEFRVNTRTANNQRYATVAMDADGDFVITWSSLGQDGSNYGVYAQRYDAAGNAAGGEFRVNTTTAKFQGRSSVAMDDDGDFVVTWESLDQDGSGVGIYYQVFTEDGARVGVESRANNVALGQQRLPHVAMNSHGDFVITWAGDPSDGSGYGIYARRFNAQGVPQGDATQSNTLFAGNQQNSTVAMDDDGDYVVAWHSSTGDGTFYGVYAQRFTPDGQKFGSQFLVNSFTANFQQFPSVGMDANGDFVIAWQSLTQDDLSYWGVYAQRYSWGGGRVGGEFRVNTYTADHQDAANLAMLPSGDFIIAWQSNLQDGSAHGIYSQRYAAQTNHAPVASAGGPYAITEGDGVTLDADGSTDSDFGQALTYAWDVNNDGVFGDVLGAAPMLSAAELAAFGIQDDGEIQLSVRVEDGFGGSHVASATLTVSNAAPSGLTLVPVADADEGSAIALLGLFTDPGVIDAHTLTIDWGDGAHESIDVMLGDRALQATHTYRNDGARTIRVTVSDDDGGVSAESQVAVNVRNAAPIVQDLQFSKIVLDEGETFTVTGRVGDAGLDDTHSLVFHWGAGVDETVPVDPVTRTFSVQHAFADDAPNGTSQDLVNLSFTLSDNGGGAITTPVAVTVRNVAPQFSGVQISASEIDEAGSVTITGQLMDPGLADVLTLTIDWGDGQSTPVSVDPVTRAFVATHAYADDNPTGTAADTYAITLAATDDDLGATQFPLNVTVRNLAPSVEIVVAPETPLGHHPVTLSANVVDVSADTFTYAWEVRLGESLIASGANAMLSFTPDVAGDYQITLVVTDDDGGATTASRTLTLCIVPGDANGDCSVDLVDLNLVRNYFGASRADAEWENFAGPIPGDVDGNEAVDLTDLNLVRNHFGESASPSPAPRTISAATRVSAGQAVTTAAAPHEIIRATDAIFASYAGPSVNLLGPIAKSTKRR